MYEITPMAIRRAVLTVWTTAALIAMNTCFCNIHRAITPESPIRPMMSEVGARHGRQCDRTYGQKGNDSGEGTPQQN